MRSYKGIICGDISEFESYHLAKIRANDAFAGPSHAIVRGHGLRSPARGKMRHHHCYDGEKHEGADVGRIGDSGRWVGAGFCNAAGHPRAFLKRQKPENPGACLGRPRGSPRQMVGPTGVPSGVG
jgi:hypothetical protein